MTEQDKVIDEIAAAIQAVKVTGQINPRHGFSPKSYCDEQRLNYPSNVSRLTPNGLYVEINLDGFAPEPIETIYDKAVSES